MTQWHRLGSRRWLLAGLLVSCLALTGSGIATAPAASLEELDVSLKWIPADAAFYSTMLRNQEQIEIIGQSKAWAKLMAMPVVQEGLKKFEEAASDPENPAAKVQAGLDNPAVQDLLAFLGDMFGRDVFVYGGNNFIDFVDLMQKLNGAQRYGQLAGQLKLAQGETDANKAQARVMLHLLATHADQIHIPDLIAGFQVKNTDRAKENLDKLMGLAMIATMTVPELANCCKRTKVGDNDYVTFSFNGQMIPWDKVPLEEVREMEMEKGDLDKVVDKLKQLKLVIALGLRDDYLLVSIGESTEALARLGSGEKLLARPEFKPLAQFADKRLASIGYASKEMNVRLATSKEDIDELVKLVDAMLEQSELTDSQRAEIRKDAAALAEDVKPLIPQPGAGLAFSFLTDQGMESYSYNYSPAANLVGTQPLSLLAHVGGNPLAAVVARGKHSPADYDLLVKWLKVAYRYFEEYAVPEMSGDEKEQYEKAVEKLRPLAKRLNQVNRQKLIPSLADGQGGLVLEAKVKSQQIAQEAPAFEQPMPLPELALVLGISNAKLFSEALEDYRQIANDTVDALHEIEPDDVPDIDIPAAKTRSTKVGTIYEYPMPEEAGLDKQLGPTVGVSEKVAVISFSRKQPQRLLTPTPLKIGGVLTDAKRPRAVGFLMQWTALVDAATPWAELAAKEIIKDQQVEEDKAKEILEQVHTVLDVLKVFRTLTGETYLKDDAVVTHSVMVVHDVE